MQFLKMLPMLGLLVMTGCATNGVAIPDRLKRCTIHDRPSEEGLSAGELSVYSNQLLGDLIECDKKLEELAGLYDKWPE